MSVVQVQAGPHPDANEPQYISNLQTIANADPTTVTNAQVIKAVQFLARLMLRVLIRIERHGM